MGFFRKDVELKPIPKSIRPLVPYEVKPFLLRSRICSYVCSWYYGSLWWLAISRAAIGGGLNIFGQLAQEGNEGDINLLSAGLGALTGAMTGPGAADKFSGMTTGSAIDPAIDATQRAEILADRFFNKSK